MPSPTLETPPVPVKDDSPPRRRITAPEEQEFHLLIEELRDENSRYRLREALWISIILHALAIFAIREVPKYLPTHNVQLLEAPELMKQRELTYVEQPPDTQKLKEKPQTDKISDKNRIATSRNPRLEKLLRELAANRRMSQPGPTTPQPPAPQPTPQQQQQAAQLGGSPPQQRTNQTAKLEQPQSTQQKGFGSFRTQSSSSAIEEAARASAQTRGGGAGGDWGTGPGRNGASTRSDVEILTDTMGVDFGPYIQRVLHAIRTNWYPVIPEVALSPLSKQGNVIIEFVIMKDGTVKGMRLASPSGDVSMDRAAWTGIKSSDPFPPLPAEFRGEYFGLRIKFMYNPDRGELLH